MSTAVTKAQTGASKKSKKSAGAEAQSALKATIKDINQAIQSGQLTASRPETVTKAQTSQALNFAPGYFAVSYDKNGAAQTIVTAGGDTLTAVGIASCTAGATNLAGAKNRATKATQAGYRHSRLKGMDVNLLNLDETYQEVSYEIKRREKRAVITEVGNGEKIAELYLGKRQAPRHMTLSPEGTQVIEGAEGRLTIDPTLTKFLLQDKDQGSIFIDLNTNKMQVTYPDGLRQTYGVTSAEAQTLKQGPIGFSIHWLIDSTGSHRFQWSAFSSYGKLPC
jgi:hypothetical protein